MLLWSQILFYGGWKPLAGVGLALLGAFLICYLHHNFAIKNATHWLLVRKTLTSLWVCKVLEAHWLCKMVVQLSKVLLLPQIAVSHKKSSDRSAAQHAQKKSTSRTCWPSQLPSIANFLAFPSAKAVRKLLLSNFSWPAKVRRYCKGYYLKGKVNETLLGKGLYDGVVVEWLRGHEQGQKCKPFCQD